jgi:hypothetical protein
VIFVSDSEMSLLITLCFTPLVQAARTWQLFDPLFLYDADFF